MQFFLIFFKEGSHFGNWRILLEDLGRGKGKRIRNKQGWMHGTPVTDGQDQISTLTIDSKL